MYIEEVKKEEKLLDDAEKVIKSFMEKVENEDDHEHRGKFTSDEYLKCYNTH